MSHAGASASPLDTRKVHKVRVQIRADGCLYEGYVTLFEANRVRDVLNDPRPFLDLTDVTVAEAGVAPSKARYVALNKGAITHLLLLGDAPAQAASPAPVVKPTPVAPPPPPPREEPSLSAEALAAMSQPMVPAAGPATMPAPPPLPAATHLANNDPPTAPYPRSPLTGEDDVDDVSDLILDDDDIDPDDLERDVGALITGSQDGA
jgi:hypothetical protein